MFIIEFFERNKWRPIKRTLRSSKKELEDLVQEMNTSVNEESIRLLPVKEKYRIRKVKKNEANGFVSKESKNNEQF